MDILCRVETLTKRYSDDEHPPIANLSLNIHRGSFFSIEGPSGTGKTTLLYLLGGLLRPDSGKILFENIDIATINDKMLTRWRKESMAFVFQETILFSALTAKENLTESLYLQKKWPRHRRQQEADAQLALLGLSARAQHLPHQLSVGQRRRLIIARALLCDAPLFLADEPTNDLDDVWAEVVLGLLAEKAKTGSAVVMVTHNDKWARRANERYVLNEGVIQKTTASVT